MRESDEDRARRQLAKDAETLSALGINALDLGMNLLDMVLCASQHGCVVTIGAEPVEKHEGSALGGIVILPPPWAPKEGE